MKHVTVWSDHILHFSFFALFPFLCWYCCGGFKSFLHWQNCLSMVGAISACLYLILCIVFRYYLVGVLGTWWLGFTQMVNSVQYLGISQFIDVLGTVSGYQLVSGCTGYSIRVLVSYWMYWVQLHFTGYQLVDVPGTVSDYVGCSGSAA